MHLCKNYFIAKFFPPTLNSQISHIKIGSGGSFQQDVGLRKGETYRPYKSMLLASN